jgi:hypothetical protein
MKSDQKFIKVFEDPITRQKMEGTARIIAPLGKVEPGLSRFLVHFVGDEAGLNVVRTIADEAKCTCCDPIHPGDDPNCPVHGKGR